VTATGVATLNQLIDPSPDAVKVVKGVCGRVVKKESWPLISRAIQLAVNDELQPATNSTGRRHSVPPFRT
jgi:hypothetical protein